MVRYVQNKLIKITIIVDISILGFNTHCISKALFIRPLRWKHAVHSLLACDENTTNLERVLYLCLTLDLRWSDVLLVSTFTREKRPTFFNMQKMCAKVDAHNK